MGLAVAAGTMREHSGSISVASALGKGTTFTLRFPLSTASTSQPTEQILEEVPSTTSKGRTVLVVDDEEMVRTVICRLLGVRGHSATGVSSGQEALDMLVEHTFDLVLTDQGMPGMTGRELAHQIRKTDSDLPVLLLTGDTDISVNPSEIGLVLTKPFRIDDVERAIASLT